MTRAAAQVAWMITIVLTAGCGLSDYENRMMQAQLRYERYEQEAKNLGNPLTIPSREDKEGQPIAPPLFVLRVPRGIQTQAENAKDPRARLLYTYRPTQANAAGPFTAVEVAWANDGSQEFTAEVMRCFSASGNPVQRQRVTNAPGREKVTFDTVEFEDGQHFYSINRWKGKDQQVIIVYWVSAQQKAAASKLIDLSLETFATGRDLGQLQAQMRSPLEAPGAK